MTEDRRQTDRRQTDRQTDGVTDKASTREACASKNSVWSKWTSGNIKMEDMDWNVVWIIGGLENTR